jgi:hypothetical protein
MNVRKCKLFVNLFSWQIKVKHKPLQQQKTINVINRKNYDKDFKESSVKCRTKHSEEC